MSEKETKKYWNLIVQLIKNPTQEERELILRANETLIDPILVQQLALFAEAMRRGGNESVAQDLIDYSTQLAERLKLIPSSKTSEGRKLIEEQRFIYQCIEQMVRSVTKKEISRIFDR